MTQYFSNLYNLIRGLVGQPKEIELKSKQKILATSVGKLLETMGQSPVDGELTKCLSAIVKSHKENDFPGHLIANNLRFEAFPNFKEIVIEYSQTILTSEELNVYIEFAEKKLQGESTSKKIDVLINELTKTLNASSDGEIVKYYKDTVSKYYMDIMRDKIEDVNEMTLSIGNCDAVIDELKKMSASKQITPTHYDLLDKHYTKGGLEAGRLYMIGGKPSGGKSTFLLNLFNFVSQKLHVAKKKNDKKYAVVYITLENDITETYDKLFSAMLKKEIKSKELTIDDRNTIVSLMQSRQDNCEYIVKYMVAQSTTTLDIMKYLDTISDDHNVYAVFIDYIDLIRSSQSFAERRFDLGLATTELRIIGKRLGCPVVTASQINTQGYSNPYTIPTMSTIDESRQKVQNADTVGLLFDIPISCLPSNRQTNLDPEKYRVLGINFDKNRDGKKGVAVFSYYTDLHLIEAFTKADSDRIYNNFLNFRIHGTDENNMYR